MKSLWDSFGTPIKSQVPTGKKHIFIPSIHVFLSHRVAKINPMLKIFPAREKRKFIIIIFIFPLKGKISDKRHFYLQ